MIEKIILAIIPIFVAVDALGTLPIYISLTYNLSKKERNKILFQSLFTAFTIAVLFIFIGKLIFKIIGITIQDFMIAGGIILFLIAVMELIKQEKHIKDYKNDFGIVPLGTPLITGPAVLTMSLIVLDQYGFSPLLISIVFNIGFAGLIFYFSDYLIKILGKPGTNALSKITSLLLASIAVMMIRKGIILLIKNFYGKI